MAGEKFIALEETSQEIKASVAEVKTTVEGVDTKSDQILGKLVDGEEVTY